MNLEELKSRHEETISQYIKVFCEKQELDFEFWVGDQTVAHFGDNYFFNFMDIKYDIDTNQPKGLIMEWRVRL